MNEIELAKAVDDIEQDYREEPDTFQWIVSGNFDEQSAALANEELKRRGVPALVQPLTDEAQDDAFKLLDRWLQ